VVGSLFDLKMCKLMQTMLCWSLLVY